MKPASIRKFDWLYLGSIAVGLLGVVLGWDTMMAQMDSELARQGVNGLEGVGSSTVVAGVGLGIAISLALWFLISLLRIEFVKWILLLLIVWSVFTTLGAVAGGIFTIEMVFGLISTVLSIAAVFYLFKPDATAWFHQKDGPDDDPAEEAGAADDQV